MWLCLTGDIIHYGIRMPLLTRMQKNQLIDQTGQPWLKYTVSTFSGLAQSAGGLLVACLTALYKILGLNLKVPVCSCVFIVKATVIYSHQPRLHTFTAGQLNLLPSPSDGKIRTVMLGAVNSSIQVDSMVMVGWLRLKVSSHLVAFYGLSYEIHHHASHTGCTMMTAP